MIRTTRRRAIAATAALALGAAGLAGCSSDSSDADATSDSAAAAASYPMTLASPYGETELEEKPERVAVVSNVDLDVALSLDVVPVISPSYGQEPEAWTQEKLEELGESKLTTFDATDGVDYEAIAEAEPDVILATSGWTLDEDYEQLSKIAPIVSYQGEDGLAAMTWAERTEEAGAALDLSDKATEVVDGVEQQFADARKEHPEFEGKTFTYAVVHPEQISYISYEGSNIDFFTNLGFELPEQASEFSETESAVSRENLDVLDADVLLVGYPFGDEGVMTKSELEKDELFQQIPAVKEGRYAVVDDLVASPLAYPSPLGEPWVIEELVPVLADAVAGS